MICRAQVRFLSACAFLGTRVQARFLGNECNSALCFVWTSATVRRRVRMCVVRCLDECERSLCVDSTNMQKCIVQCLDECKCLACLCCCLLDEFKCVACLCCCLRWTSSSASRAFGLDRRERVSRVFLSYDGLVRVRRAFDFVGRVRVRRAVHFLSRVLVQCFFLLE